MRYQHQRKIIARLLLSVFVPMMMFAALHVHQPAAANNALCVECVSHQPHADHLMAAQPSFHDCVLCQLASLPFLLVVSAVLQLPGMRRVRFSLVGNPAYCRCVCSKHQLRAPPFSFFTSGN